MLLAEINEKLRDMFIGLEDAGYKKTDMGKLLLGSSGYSSMCKFISKDVEHRTSFGMRPIERMAEQAGYTVQIAIIKKDSDEHNARELTDCKTEEFLTELPTLIERYLNNSYTVEMQKKRKSQSSDAITEILSDIGL